MIRTKDYRQYLMIASAMLLSINFCACSSSSDIIEDTQEEEQVPMAFGANVSESTQTRALIEDIDGLKALTEGFGVYGYKIRTSETTPTQVFSNQSVTFDTSNTPNKWTYSPLKYWDKSQGMNYYFTAYAPRVSNETSNTSIYASSVDDKHTITINNIPQWQDASNGYDLIVADKGGSSSSTTVFPSGTVNLDFHHKLALLEIKAFTTSSTYKISSIEIPVSSTTREASVPNEKRNYTHTYKTNSSDEFSTWTANTEAVEIFNNSNGSAQISTDTVTITKKLVAPFKITNETSYIPIKLTYYRTDENGKKVSGTADITSNNILIENKEFQEFKSDYKYTLTIEIKGAGDVTIISVVQVAIEAWDPEPAIDHPVYNW